jgi:hypothetical protein
MKTPSISPTVYSITCLGLSLLLSTARCLSAADLIGAEANPTGEPIGGGTGYSLGPKREAARFCAATSAELEAALEQAKGGDIVWVEDGRTIDLGDAQIVVPEKVTLAGDRGEKGSSGPLLTVGMSNLEWRIALKPGARLTGVRFRGPNPLMRDIDARNPPPSGFAVSCADAEVDNCEISQFQRGGIALFRDSERAHIHHNHLHDIAAYPVLVGNGSGDGHIIEANRIEWAWHAIAGNGSRGSGYEARYNIFVRVPRPKSFDNVGPSPPNWCLDMHVNNGAETRPPRPATRRFIAHHNTFLAHPDVKVGDGSDLLITNGLYPKHDIYIGPAKDMTTTVDIHHNRFLMLERSKSEDKLRPFGRAVRLVGLKGHPALEDDGSSTEDVWQVSIHDNSFGAP